MTPPAPPPEPVGVLLAQASIATPLDDPGSLMGAGIGALAYELAAGLTERREILARYAISIPVFRRLIAHPVFQDMLRKAKTEFTALASTPDRVRLKAQLLTELGLTEMWGIVRSVRSPEAARVSAYNAIKALTGMDKPEEATPLQRFSLKINIHPSAGSPAPVIIDAEASPAGTQRMTTGHTPTPLTPIPTIKVSSAGVSAP
jgi:hypothetical protein